MLPIRPHLKIVSNYNKSTGISQIKMSILQHRFIAMYEIENIHKIDSVQDSNTIENFRDLGWTVDWTEMLNESTGGAALTVDGGAAITGRRRRSQNRFILKSNENFKKKKYDKKR